MIFKIKSEYTLFDLMRTIDIVYDSFWLNQDGFIESSLVETDKMIFAHIMLWDNENCLKLCQKNMIKHRGEFEFFDIIEVSSLEQYLGDGILKWNKKM